MRIQAVRQGMRGNFVAVSIAHTLPTLTATMYSFEHSDYGFQPRSDSRLNTSTTVHGPRAVADITNRLEGQRVEIEEMKLRQAHLEERLASQQKENDTIRAQLHSFKDQETGPRKQKQRLPRELSVCWTVTVIANCGLTRYIARPSS